ncbi:MAG: hypothetical protein HY866_22995 [Chloroflexi bacterium]|nr:hypothetical protein [Chloroflexota bacterium]
MAHLPGQVTAIPGLRIRHEPVHDTRRSGCSSFFAMEDTDLKRFAFETHRRRCRRQSDVPAAAFPARVIFQKFRVIIPFGDKIRQTAFGIIRDFIQKLFILPALERFDQRIHRRVPRVG